MTEEENQIMVLTKDIWQKFNELNVEHPSDIDDLKFHIHAIQNIVLSRVGIRIYKKEYQ